MSNSKSLGMTTSAHGNREFDEIQTRDYLMGAASIIGTRAYQQDSYSYSVVGNTLLAVICDGMGGLNGGEKASGLSVGMLCSDFEKTDFSTVSYPDFLQHEAVKIDEMVFNLPNENGTERLGAGTTVVATILEDRKMFILSAGDSKIYLIRKGKMITVNREHNYRMELDEKYRNGEINEAEYQAESLHAEALISFLGIGDISLLDVNDEPIELQKDDLLVLCSDGVYKSLNEPQICAVALDNSFDVALASKRLVNSAFDYRVKGQDNTTAIVIRVK